MDDRQDRVEALRRVLRADPDDQAIRLLLADILRGRGDSAEALDEYEAVFVAGAMPDHYLVPVGYLALEDGAPGFARRLAETARRRGLDQEGAALAAAIDEKVSELWGFGGAPQDPMLEALLVHEDPVTFAEVGGLDQIKDVIRKRIILPFSQPELVAAYGRRAGGSVLMYGPPGCGKTLLARATAGECALPFLNVRLELILDPEYGMSEQRIHAAFQSARRSAPCVLFLDEVDALAYARRKRWGGQGQAQVDQLLQELDAVGSDNREILVLAATNAPWDVDDAMRRPGRFDRNVFVPPPDAVARAEILTTLLADLPKEEIALDALSAESGLFSGADLKALVDRAVDAVLEQAMSSDETVPLTTAHLAEALKHVRPTTLEWLATARNWVEFSNDGGQYDDVAAFLQTDEVRRAFKRR